MFEIGFQELFLLGVIALLVVGPERLPGLARTVGVWVGKAQRLVGQVRADVEREIRAEELKQSMKEYSPAGTLTDMRKEMEDLASEVSRPVATDGNTTTTTTTTEGATAAEVAARPGSVSGSGSPTEAGSGSAPESQATVGVSTGPEGVNPTGDTGVGPAGSVAMAAVAASAAAAIAEEEGAKRSAASPEAAVAESESGASDESRRTDTQPVSALSVASSSASATATAAGANGSEEPAASQAAATLDTGSRAANGAGRTESETVGPPASDAGDGAGPGSVRATTRAGVEPAPEPEGQRPGGPSPAEHDERPAVS